MIAPTPLLHLDQPEAALVDLERHLRARRRSERARHRALQVRYDVLSTENPASPLLERIAWRKMVALARAEAFDQALFPFELARHVEREMRGHR